MEHYIISPDIFQEKVSFVWDDDLWLKNGEKGHPTRLTSNLGIVTNSRFSPDGRHIAFRTEVGKDGSAADIYTIKLEDGHITRLTYLSGRSTSRRMFTDVAGWTPDGRVVVSTDFYRPFGAMTELYTVNTEGGPLQNLNLGHGSNIMFADDEIIIGRNTVDMPHWKGYKGGTSGVLWKGTVEGEFLKFLDLKHHISSPMLINKRVFFITDRDGTGNLYSVNMKGEDLKKHTNYTDFHVRNAKTDGQRIVFQHAGDLYRFDPSGNQPEKMDIDTISGSSSLEDSFPDAADYLEYYSVDPSGKKVSIVTRGQAFTASFQNGPVLATGSSGEHIKFANLVNGNALLYVSDSEGGEDLFITDLKTGGRRKIEFSEGIVESLVVSIDGSKVLLSNNRGDLFSVDVPASSRSKIDFSPAGVITDFSFSRDGKSVVYSYPEIGAGLGREPGTIVKLYSYEDGKTFRLSESNSRDLSPIFSNDGDYILFLSTRNLDPSADGVVFDFSFPVTKVLSVIPMSTDALLRLDGIPEEYVDQDNEKFSPEELGEHLRILSLKPSEYSSLQPVNDGVLLLEYPVEGMSKYSAMGMSKRTGRLMKYSLKTMQSEVVREGCLDFKASADGKTVIHRDSSRNLMRTDLSNPASSGNVKFSFSRVKLKVNPRKEWNQMFWETKRLVREIFWREEVLNQHPEAFEKYDKLLGRIKTRFELSDIIREFQGEIGHSHCYEIGGDLSSYKAHSTGKLGLDGTFQNGKYVITHIMKANFSNDGEKSPVYNSTVKLQEGDVISTIDGVEISESVQPEQVLYNRGNDYLRIGIEREGKNFSVFVKTLGDDRKLRYREWVERNREYVHEQTGGRVGYIHLPDMGMNGFAEFARLYPIESKKDALIVDVRFNGGGNVSQLVLEKLTKKRIAYSMPRRGEAQAYPRYSVNGPILALTNESAGSDGDIFTHAFKLMGLGPVIGTRTWGGVHGISPRHKLVDGTIVTQPQSALWFKDVGFGAENHGSEPTIEVHNSPSDYRDGVDRQLEKGLEKIQEMLKGYNNVLKSPE